MATKELKTKKPAAVSHKTTPKTLKSTKIGAKVAKALKNPPKGKKSTRVDEKENKVVLRIRIRAYESKILDASVKQIIDTAMRYDAEIVGPVPLPTEIKKYTVNRASFVYKNTREQFEIRVHKRLID